MARLSDMPLALEEAGPLRAHHRPRVKHSPLAGQLIELECRPIMEALRILSARFGVQRVARFGPEVHVHVDDGERAQREIHELLEQGGIKIESSRIIIPTIEDLFISLVEKEEQR